MSAARKLGQLYPNQKIILVDAQLAGEGASGRNSGYLVDTTLNDGFTSNKELENYKKKSDIYALGINSVKKFIKEYNINLSKINYIGLSGQTIYHNPDKKISIQLGSGKFLSQKLNKNTYLF